MNILSLITGIVTEGLIYSIMAYGIYISLKILNFPDLSTDGTFPLGMACAVSCILKGINPFVSLLIAFALGMVFGAFTGFLLRAAGDNENLIITLAKNPGKVKITGLAFANGLIATSGAIYLQYIKSFNVSAGTGSLVIGLAAVIIGTSIFGRMKFIKPTTGVVAGMIIYKAFISIAMLLGLQSKDTNLVVSVLFVAVMVFGNRKEISAGRAV